ncbi:hypothetical protein GC722_00355 [Auraticoccus sp. F435]|uniref:Uncharacterized protein n=1 Tax=Auraticoccus cholistanensis TaxID=2656650 RepID=A0A6A9UP72_9ACTN|nr:hypothetical protein [Auraticoccus cholistanensis]
MPDQQLHLTPSLTPENRERDLRVLRTYFPSADGLGGYTGGRWDTFDPSGTRADQANEITSDDLVSLTLLSVNVSADIALQLLGPMRATLSALLQDLGPDRDLVDEPSLDGERFSPAWALERELRAVRGLGATKVSKLMARKRPRLIPVYDRVIKATLTGGTGVFWRPLHAALLADDGALHHRLIALRDDAGLPADVSALRVLDVLAWMDGQGYSERLLTATADEQPNASEVAAAEREAELDD